MKKKKRKLSIKKIIRFVIFILLILLIIYGIINLFGSKIFDLKKSVDKYLASDVNTVNLYTYSKVNDETDEVISIEDSLVRGTKVSTKGDSIILDNVEYTLITYLDKEYYVVNSNLVDKIEDIVLENTMFVRTSVTVYKNEIDSKIESFIKKGNELEILDYDKVFDDGNVNMYKIRKDDITGWVYGKYLVNDMASAEANYNENGVYDIHKNRKFSRELYGGSASTLDYYPYERVEFEDNPLLKNATTMYLNAKKSVISNIDKYLEIAKSSGVNAIVVDIKDGGLAYKSKVANEYLTTSYKPSNDNSSYASAIKKIKDAGIYVIGRIVVFKDFHYGKDHPEDIITSPLLGKDQVWPSVYSRRAWEYNVELAKEAVREFGFNEIQFDYVRFPESSSSLSANSKTDFKNVYNEEKAEAVQNFLFYALDQLHKEGVYLSVDVFGECSSTYVTAYGQYWPAISNIVDVISSMPYTDHFGDAVDTWSDPYKTVYNWGVGASKRQKEIPTPAVARTWITAYDTPNWDATVVYDASKISAQAQALVDAGLNGGFITWNSASSLNKYEQIKSAFSKTYK